MRKHFHTSSVAATYGSYLTRSQVLLTTRTKRSQFGTEQDLLSRGSCFPFLGLCCSGAFHLKNPQPSHLGFYQGASLQPSLPSFSRVIGGSLPTLPYGMVCQPYFQPFRSCIWCLLYDRCYALGWGHRGSRVAALSQ